MGPYSMICKMKTAADVIDALGGYRRLASAIGVPPTTVSAWKSRGSIPAHQWSKLVEQARQVRLNGVTLESLASLQKNIERKHKSPRKMQAQNRKASVRIEIDSRLLAEASELGLSLEAFAESSLREQILSAKRARWQAEHADVIDWYNEHIERDGVFGDEGRTF